MAAPAFRMARALVRREAVAGIETSQRVPGRFGDGPGAVGHARELGVVGHHHLAVRAQVDVGLDDVGSLLERPGEARQRVLG